MNKLQKPKKVTDNKPSVIVKRKTVEELIKDKEAMYDNILKLESDNKRLYEENKKLMEFANEVAVALELIGYVRR